MWRTLCSGVFVMNSEDTAQNAPAPEISIVEMTSKCSLQPYGKDTTSCASWDNIPGNLQ